MKFQLADITLDHMREYDIPGVALAVVRDGEIVHEDGVGLANVANEAPAGPRTAWPICSLTKSMTCTAVMQLAEQRLVDIDLPVATYLPSWRVRDPDAGPQITVKMLMHHGSGLGRVGFQDRVRQEAVNPYPTRESLMEAITGADLQSEPGRFWAYSNEGFATLGHIVETISGVPLEEYFLTRIFEPLGMNDTRVHFSDWRSATDRVVNYIRPELGEKSDGDPHGAYQPGFLPEDYQTYLSTGGIVSTAHDLALYQAAAMNYDGSPVLGRDALEQMQSAAFKYGDTGWGYGFGWSVFWSGDIRVVGHAGGMVGLNTYSLFVPSEQLGVVVVTNRSEAGAFQLAEKFVGEVRGTPLWRDSVEDALPFESSYVAPNNESPTAFDGDYAHGNVVVRIEGIDDGMSFKLLRDGVQEFEDTATRVGPESFLSRKGAHIMQFTLDDDGRGEVHLEGGLLWHRVPGS